MSTKKTPAPRAMNTVEARTHADWRTWLATHHDQETEVWLVFHKRHTGKEGVAYNDALDEALCYGWVDSLVKRIDENRYARKFTPRRANSIWSAVNRKRYAELAASGRLAEPGKQRAPTDRRYPAVTEHKRQAGLPSYIRKALATNAKAREHFEKLAPSHRRNYVAWIDSAKKEETKQRRLEEAIRLLGQGKTLGLK
jgi:uncharacterized protein YdeI (YjbR/CyaY-like superfamily)